jgi:peptidoglycan hydrolase-like protein with peptidoglycan-binding domain
VFQKMSVITGSVGQGGVNNLHDVRSVQFLLNDWREANERPRVRVDGLVGPNTQLAIRDFQTNCTRVVDGRIDPSGPAIRSLCQSFATRMSCRLDDMDDAYRGLAVAPPTAIKAVQIGKTLRPFLGRFQGGLINPTDFLHFMSILRILGSLWVVVKSEGSDEVIVNELLNVKGTNNPSGLAERPTKKEAARAAKVICKQNARCTPEKTEIAKYADCVEVWADRFGNIVAYQCTVWCRCPPKPVPTGPPVA